MRYQKGAADLRETLFRTLEGVWSGTISSSKAKSICDIAREINESVKSEVLEVRILREMKLLSNDILNHNTITDGSE